MAAGLAKQWCVILGASSGMGRATALAVAAEGANIVGLHFDTASGQPQVDELTDRLAGYGVEVRFFNANAASPATRAEVIPQIADLAGESGVRLLMHSLAFGTLLPFLPSTDGPPPISARQLDMTLNVMAHSLVYWTQDLFTAGLLRRGSKIVAMTSGGSTRVTRSYGAVSAAKSALESHVRQLALELAGHGVAVNAIRAGITLTPSLLRIPEHEELVERVGMRNPHGRLTTPEDVAEAITALCGTESSWMTGNVIGVDGGEALT
jgi:NAD(P)-dependent dehydrogenase (short-subunit alcohol dehydrogenase family)